jgi:hypothetical protein
MVLCTYRTGGGHAERNLMNVDFALGYG